MSNQVKVYPIPQDVPKQADYLLRVRPVGEETWQELAAYQVIVDMHDRREASMVYFDFTGAVELEITFPRFYTVYDVQIRPEGLNYDKQVEEKRIVVTIDQPGNFSLEINKDRFHNLHVFAGAIEDVPAEDGENIFFDTCSNEFNEELAQAPAGRLVYVRPGIHWIASFIWSIPSHTRVYLAPGAVLMGGLQITQAEDIEIFGRGVIYQGHLPLQYYTHGLSIDYSTNVKVSGITFINPLHYTISFGNANHVTVVNTKTFSCHGWTDGFDMMSSQNITIDGCFLRTSDDCITVYGSRWKSFGDSRNVTVKNSVLWADVAHPITIGCHGDHGGDGDIIENLHFENIDILEHHEFQPGYLGTMALNPGDKNTVRNVTFKDIRIDAFEHGAVFDIQVKYNEKYNPAPGRRIENISFDGIYVKTGDGEETSIIKGYDDEHIVTGVSIKNYYRDGHKVTNLQEGNIQVGDFARNITIE